MPSDANVDMVETRGYTLEEVAFAFDGPNASLTDVSLMPNLDHESSGDADKARDGEDYKMV